MSELSSNYQSLIMPRGNQPENDGVRRWLLQSSKR